MTTSTTRTTPTRGAALPEITRHDRARYVKEARRLRAAEFDRVFRAIGRALARLAGKGPVPPAPARRPGLELPWGARPL